jgi:hypothetical protein
MPSRALSDWLASLHDLRTQFGPEAAHRKLAKLAARRRPAFFRADDLVAYHDTLLFMRAYADGPALMAETERRLRAFRVDVARYRTASGDRQALGLADSGLVDTAVSHVYSFRMARALSAMQPRAVEIDWDAYWQSDTANIPIALVPAMLWHESDAVDNDEHFDERAWLERNRTPSTPTCLSALLTLFATSGLPERVQEHLYDQAEIPLRWHLGRSRASRTLKRVTAHRPFPQTGPLRGRSADLRVTLAGAAAPLHRVTGGEARRLVADVREVLASRVRELYPLAGASDDEVYRYDAGRGLRFVLYGSTPAIRLPHESNIGALFVRNGVPIGYGLGAMIFRQGEMAINVFPAYRNGESAFLIEEFFRLFVHHFGARTLVVSAYQVGDGNDEGLDSGAFWFYHKLGFRPVDPAVRQLAERQAARIARQPTYRTSRAMLKRLARSDVFFHLDPSAMDRHQPIGLADLGYAVTHHVARAYGGDRTRAVAESIRAIARHVPLGDTQSWTEDERLGLQRLAPLVDAIGGTARWPARDRELLARLLRAKGGRCERDFITLAQQLPRLEAGMRRLARREATRRRPARPRRAAPAAHPE